MNRREFIKKVSRATAGLVFMSGRLCATAKQLDPEQEIDDLDKYDFIMPRVKFPHIKRPGMSEGPDYWKVRPGGDRNLLNQLSTVIRCKTKPIPNVGYDGFQPQDGKEDQFNAVVTFDDIEKISKYPFLFMTDENEFRFSQTQKNNVREYIHRGGFLFMDDCVYDQGGDFFYRSAYDLLEEVFGRNSVKAIPNEHEIFHNVYDLSDIGLPYLKGQKHGARGVFIGERLAVLLSSHDIHCGWCDTNKL